MARKMRGKTLVGKSTKRASKAKLSAPKKSKVKAKRTAAKQDFSQGSLQSTGVNTHVAIQGEGFFVVKGDKARGRPEF